MTKEEKILWKLRCGSATELYERLDTIGCAVPIETCFKLLEMYHDDVDKCVEHMINLNGQLRHPKVKKKKPLWRVLFGFY